MVKRARRGDEEVVMLVRWESEEAWKNWEKSPEHFRKLIYNNSVRGGPCASETAVIVESGKGVVG